jgi:hypothetical protein
MDIQEPNRKLSEELSLDGKHLRWNMAQIE